MHFSKIATMLALVATSLAAPTTQPQKRADVLTFQTYNNFQISDGTAGNALAEVNKAFPVDISNPASVSANDLAILIAARQTSENAEATFNTAVAAASGSAATALQIGKIKNKVLKLRTFEMLVTVQIAQGATDKAAQLADIQTKLAANVKTDQASKGKASQSVSFTNDVQPK
ncbi:hypothetical protein BKA67DRAFT_690935 [Truncatella angustata]|uniref:Small secreted protein n=1 Tax=Truncatella angustata TaxID=152316 RepID=A0A9P8UKE0_9PEZI|nr:uncharacterized protein BKA67DRAFT_690935 [Truncatella angustata]KAH6653819.1 hypothetical protein BKA67DRAFT_690935 [Truncatella angustata]KAH8197585.1 hypothetical protein TruAng_008269 [Truncatella angustata]